MTALRSPPTTRFEFFERGWRPLLAWSCGFIVAAFVVAMLGAVVWAVWKAVLTGTSLPNLTGGLESLFVPSLPYLAAICGTLWGLMRARSHEVQREIETRGPRQPFPSSPVLPVPANQVHEGGSLVNNEAIQ